MFLLQGLMVLRRLAGFHVDVKRFLWIIKNDVIVYL